MLKSRTVLLGIALACIGLLSFGLYMQHVLDMQPCPLCVLQRYAFSAIAIFCLIGAAANTPRAAGGLALLSALTGGGIAGYHLWVQAHPAVSCGIDPLETSLNTILTARWLPFLFKADGFCTTPYPPLLGLSTPQWAMVWFVIFALTLIWVVLRRPSAK
jgi:protein dithiol:quinone oxidoreductase